jgi:hypothetical protein
VDSLVPLPQGLDARRDPATALAWIEQHRTELRWHLEEGRFRIGE